MEKHYETFNGKSLDELIKSGIAALRASAQDTDLTEHNVSIGVLGKDTPYRSLSRDELRTQLNIGGGDVEMIQS
jgi:20S proteasome subunit alpha 6